MKIWFAANIPHDSCGGVARSIKELSKHVRTLGFRTEIMYGAKGAIRGNYIYYAVSLCGRMLLGFYDPPAWIIARSTDGVFCAIAAKIVGIKTKIVLYNHGWEEIVYALEKKLPQSIVNAPSTWKARLFRFPLLRASLYFCTWCLSGTQFETRWLAQKYPRYKKKLKYLSNGATALPEAYWEKQTGIANNFLSVGGATWKKNLIKTVAIFRQIAEMRPEANLSIVGAKAHDVDCCGNLNKITFVESEDLETMFQWYRRCPFLISSSRYEGGHSLAILEAMAFGCVVFVSDIFASREIVIDKRNGIVMSGANAEHDARMIVDVLEDKDLVARIRHNAFRTAQRNSWFRQARRLKAIICANQ